jgi:hypothetical protein
MVAAGPMTAGSRHAARLGGSARDLARPAVAGQGDGQGPHRAGGGATMTV